MVDSKNKKPRLSVSEILDKDLENWLHNTEWTYKMYKYLISIYFNKFVLFTY